MEAAARGAGWLLGVVGVQPGAGAASDASIPAVFVVGTARFRIHPKILRSDAILERSVGPWCCRVRACAFRIAALPSGMRVVCVRGLRQAKGGMPRQDLQTCARMTELAERIQNHIGFMGSFRR